MTVGVGVDPEGFNRDAATAGMRIVNGTIVRLSPVVTPHKA